MKNYINKISLLLACAFIGTSCSIHDQIDDLVAVGGVAPTVYWEGVDNGVKAGADVKFELQYYSPVKKDISKLEIWYNIYSTTKILATCPIVTFTYNVAQEETELIREFVPVIGYVHSENNWNQDKRTYHVKGTFPTSYTLEPTIWANVEVFDEKSYKRYFPEGFEKAFRDSVYAKMKVADFRKVLTQTNRRIPPADFNNYIDSVLNEATGRMDYWVKDQYVGMMKEKFYDIRYDSLFYDSGSSKFMLGYYKEQLLGAKFKVVDADGVENYSEEKEIELR